MERFQQNLPHNIEFVNSWSYFPGRRVALFEDMTIRFILERLGLDCHKYAGIKTSEELAEEQRLKTLNRFWNSVNQIKNCIKKNKGGYGPEASVFIKDLKNGVDMKATSLIFCDWLDETGHIKKADEIRNLVQIMGD